MRIQNARVVLILVVLLAVVGVIGYIASRPSVESDDSPEPKPEERADARPQRSLRPGSVTGEVRILRTKDPAVGIEVRIEGADEVRPVETSESGSFAVSVPGGVEVTLTVEAPDPYARIVIPGVVVEPGKTENLGTLFLERALVLKGLVVDRSGRPVPDAAVRAYRPTLEGTRPSILTLVTTLTKRRTPLEDTRSDRDGAFVFRSLSPGTYRIEASADDYALGYLPGVIVSPEAEGRTIKLTLYPGLRLSGTVKEGSGAPLEGATVTVMRFGGRSMESFEFEPVQEDTDDKGEFEFTNLTAGRATLMVNAEGYPLHIEDRFQVGQQDRLDVVLGGKATIRGKVKNAKGDPVEGASVMAVVGNRGPAFGNTTTDVEGRYEIAHLPAGKIQFFTVRKDGYPPHPKMDPMAFGRSGIGELSEGEVLTKDVTLADGAVVTGKVTDSASGRPVAGAEVTILAPVMFQLGGGSSGISGEDGTYRVEGVGEGLHLILVKASGFYQESMDPRILQSAFRPGSSGEVDPDAPVVQVGEETDEVTKNLTVLPGVVITGKVVAPDGTPVSGARVTFEGADRELGMMMRFLRMAPKADLTNDAGEFRLTGTPGGD
ncbi:MAG: carboxypeptidase regulatory-like domain-containing protein, partial [Planctomycetota bacterium]